MRRRQLTLFLVEEESASIEWIRERFNPQQYGLIKSHITLCREEEIEDLKIIQNNLEHLEVEVFELEAGSIKRFSEGKGVLIPIKDPQLYFQQLRAAVLKNINSNPRIHKAHITLMHPRNSTCNDSIFEEIKSVRIPRKFKILKISLIEQEVGKEWEIKKEYALKNKGSLKLNN